MGELVDSLRHDLPADYGAIPGFRGLLVLEKPGANHVIALTLWEDETGLAASEPFAESYAERIADAVGTAVARNVYNVLGTLGMGGAP